MTRSKAKLSKRGFVRIEEVITTLVRHGLDTPELRRCGTWSARMRLVWGRLTGRSTVRFVFRPLEGLFQDVAAELKHRRPRPKG